MEAARTSESLVNVYQITGRYTHKTTMFVLSGVRTDRQILFLKCLKYSIVRNSRIIQHFSFVCSHQSRASGKLLLSFMFTFVLLIYAFTTRVTYLCVVA